MVSTKQVYYSGTPAQRQDTARRKRFEQESAREEKALYNLVKKFILDNPNSLASIHLLNEYRAFLFDSKETGILFSKLAANIRQSEAGQLCAAYLARIKATEVGAQAPEFSQLTSAGQRLSLRELRGQYVLLHFWASWCGPCRTEHPGLVAIYNQYKAQNFTVLSVSLDDSRQSWLRAVAADKLPWPQLSDLKRMQNEVAHLYGVETIPQSFLIDPNGNIVAKNLSNDELAKLLSRLTSAKKRQ